jgi:mxaJ protein
LVVAPCKPDPPARLIEAVSHRDVTLAIAWGPLAGYFAQRQREPLDLVPVSPQIDPPFLPFVFDIAMGVRWEDEALGEELDRVIVRRAAEIDRILEDYGVPFVRRVRRTATR